VIRVWPKTPVLKIILILILIVILGFLTGFEDDDVDKRKMQVSGQTLFILKRCPFSSCAITETRHGWA
jgi:hypothetical protein